MPATARDRARLAQQLEQEIEARRKLLADRGETPEPFIPTTAEPLPPSTGPAVKPTRGRLRDFFSPASPAQIRWYAEVNYRIAGLRRYCESSWRILTRLMPKSPGCWLASSSSFRVSGR